jgi:copper chaperone NosL
MKNTFSGLSRVLLVLSAVFLVISMFVPLWQIQLDAPQYPEGLTLKIFANKLGGNVDIINGLNHYIGMKTLHAEDFIEFSILVYIISFYAIFSLLASVAGRKKILYILFSMFVIFGVVAMADFWRWEYAYGHDLDPNAAIIVPGMAYQPPLIGFKQLLNFGAYSIPDIGGWMFIGSGMMMLLAVLQEAGILKKISRMRKGKVASAIFLMIFLSACGVKGPEPISLNKDHCDFCKMTISELRFASELVTAKGRIYKFDDVACMINYVKENKDKLSNASYFVSEFTGTHALTEVEKLSFVKGSGVGSPMGGNIAAFSIADSAEVHVDRLQGRLSSWEELNPI